jgi:hypothetical protein
MLQKSSLSNQILQQLAGEVSGMGHVTNMAAWQLD